MNNQAKVEVQVSNQPSQQSLVRPLFVVLAILSVLLLVGLFIWGVILLAQNYSAEIEAIRDIFIIFLALSTCLFGVVILLLLVMVVRLVNMLEFEIKPILEKTNETVGMVRGTTVFVSQNVVKPVTIVGSYIAGIRRGVKTLFGDPRRNLTDSGEWK
jgi:hypothetical protein